MESSPSPARPSVVLLRGHQANPWELQQWQDPAISERYAVSYLQTRRAWFDTSGVSLERRRIRALRDLLPPGALGDQLVRVPGDRYLGLRRALRGTDIVHAQELGYWYSMQAAKLKRELGFRLALTVWETIPLLGSYRNVRTRAYRELVLAQADVFIAMTERAATALLLEGVEEARIRVSPPGVAAAPAADVSPGATPLVLSPGRLVWEKGHQDVLRALALLRKGLRSQPPLPVRLVIVGKGPEEALLRSYAEELGVADAVELRGFVPYAEMRRLYAEASCVVLASLPTRYWEEQFGMVLAEAMAANRPLVASSSGAIPEVAGGAARYFNPGDWIGLAELLRETLASGGAPGAPGEGYPLAAAAARLASVYDELLGDSGLPAVAAVGAARAAR